MGGEQAAAVLAEVRRPDDPEPVEEFKERDPRAVRRPGLAVLLHRAALGRRRDRPRRHPSRPRHGAGRGRPCADPHAVLRRLPDVTGQQMFTKVLIANRGEIAVRVQRTCRRLGIATVAVHTDLDAAAPHVRGADESVRVESYLDIDAVVAAARRTGAQAVHPGYGFLSERAAFARALEEAGIVLVGPSATVMEQMGRKDAAREIAVAAGVPVVPQGEDAEQQLGFPVLVKAAAGGGGKGMRIVRSAEEYDEAVAVGPARGRLGLRRRHDPGGEVRRARPAHRGAGHRRPPRHRPAPLRARLLDPAPAPEGARGGARADHRPGHPRPGHRCGGGPGRGTSATPTPAPWSSCSTTDTGEVYFLEMNTRLQVEHPVTELVCGRRGRRGPRPGRAPAPGRGRRAAVHRRGHAQRARHRGPGLCRGLLRRLPAAGRHRHRGAAGPAGVRVDHALESGQVVSTSYDPMLGKVVAHGPDRESRPAGPGRRRSTTPPSSG